MNSINDSTSSNINDNTNIGINIHGNIGSAWANPAAAAPRREAAVRRIPEDRLHLVQPNEDNPYIK